MTLSAPTQLIFMISIVLGIVGLLASFGIIGGAIAGYSFWLVTAAWVLLAAGSLLKGL